MVSSFGWSSAMTARSMGLRRTPGAPSAYLAANSFSRHEKIELNQIVRLPIDAETSRCVAHSTAASVSCVRAVPRERFAAKPSAPQRATPEREEDARILEGARTDCSI